MIELLEYAKETIEYRHKRNPFKDKPEIDVTMERKKPTTLHIRNSSVNKPANSRSAIKRVLKDIREKENAPAL